jgi:hypothetical protein
MEMTSQRSRVSNRPIGPSKIDRRIAVALLVLAVFALVMHVITGNRSPATDKNSIEPPASSVTRGTPSYPHDFGTVDTALPASIVPAALKLPAVNLPDPFIVLGDSPQWFTRASRGNPVAAQAVFFLLQNCRSFGPAIATLDPQQMPRESNEASRASNCQSIPQNFGDDPFYWLEFAARNGDPLSQVVYAHHADTLQQNSRPQDPGRRAAIRAKAVTYLQQAATRGVADAYLMLASSYERGSLTQKNPALAYSYLSALAAVTGDPGAANKAMSLRSSLPDAGAAEATAAKLAASCCRSATHRPEREEEN